MSFLKIFKVDTTKIIRKTKRVLKYIKSALEKISDKRPRNFISFSEAIHLMDEAIASKNGYQWHKSGVEWNKAGITTKEFARSVILTQLPLYECTRSIYGSIVETEIPRSSIPSPWGRMNFNKFNNDYTVILSHKGEQLFTSFFVQKSELERKLKYVEKHGLDFNPIESYFDGKKNDWVYLK